jgi:polar amino acid transport system substrate-binding protein
MHFWEGNVFKMMTKRLGVFLVAVILFASSASIASETEEWPVLQRIVKSGKIRVGMSGDQAPFNAISKTGEFIGFEVDLIKMIGQSMGVEVEFVTKPFPELLPALKASEVDIVMSGMAINAERSLDAVFVGPYMMSGKSILTNSETLAAARTAKEVDQANITVAALRNSTSEAYVKKHLPKAKLITTEKYDAAIQMVIKDEVDALVADMPACMLAVFRYPDQGLETLSAPLTVEPVGIAVPASELSLQSLLENYLDAFEDSGLLDLLRVQWLESGDWVDQLP